MNLTRRAALVTGAACAWPAASAQANVGANVGADVGPDVEPDSGADFGAAVEAFTHAGRLTQGGFLIGRAPARAAITVDGTLMGEASAGGVFVVGFDRDAAPTARVAVRRGGRWAAQDLAIAPVAYDVQRIDGLPVDQVSPTDPALLARIAAELKLKLAALASRDDTTDFADGFAAPLEHAVRTSHFGPQRILDGIAKPPHYGVDLAAPSGTPIRAPAAGLVVLAQPDMHFEGGLTLIDHGQGLVAGFLHQSRQHVIAGERVVAGQTIGEVGMKGRATGPHLCWRLTWRGRHMDPSLWLPA